MSRYILADEAATKLAEEIIEDYYPELESLRVDFIFDKKDTASWGTTKKVSGLNAYLAAPMIDRQTGRGGDDLFVIVLNCTVWGQLTNDQHRALLDHQLAHCCVEEDEETGTVKLSVVGPPFGEFPAIIDRHGVNWRPDLQAFFQRVHKSGQLELLDMGAPAKPDPVSEFSDALDHLHAMGAEVSVESAAV